MDKRSIDILESNGALFFCLKGIFYSITVKQLCANLEVSILEKPYYDKKLKTKALKVNIKNLQVIVAEGIQGGGRRLSEAERKEEREQKKLKRKPKKKIEPHRDIRKLK